MKSQESNTQVFVGLLSANYYRISAFIQSQVMNNSDVDDIMQDTLLVMWEQFHTFTPGTDFAKWAVTIAKFRILEFRRRKKRGQSLLSQETLDLIERDCLDMMGRAGDRMQALKQCISKLPSADRQLLKMRYSEEISVKGISKRVGNSIHIVYRNLVRIRTLLLGCIHRTLQVEGCNGI